MTPEPRDPGAPDPVAQYTATLAGSLHGPRRAKDRLVGEVGDGLREAAAAHRRDEVDLAAAVERAVADFGRPDELAPACQSELTVRQTRATALVLVLAVAALLVCWHLLWVGDAADGWTLAARAVAVVPTLGALVAGATVVLTGRCGRALPTPARLPSITAWTATATSVAMLVVTASLVAHGHDPAAPVAACAAVTVALHAAVASSARSCRRALRWSAPS